MSGGEKARLVLAIIVYQKPNLLLLDEPTNHLDLEMRHALNMALQGFDGAMVLVSHDRFLLASVCEDFYLVDSGHAAPFDGDLDDYREWILSQQGEQKPAKESRPKDDRKAQKRKDAEFRQAIAPYTKALQKHEKQLEKLSAELSSLETRLSDTQLYNDDNKAKLMALLNEQKQLTAAQEETEMAWMEAQEAIEQARQDYDSNL
tara:strand:- start:73 stop:684 length:612 start_codon:yes stop_codon:yes gene_type:complete